MWACEGVGGVVFRSRVLLDKKESVMRIRGAGVVAACVVGAGVAGVVFMPPGGAPAVAQDGMENGSAYGVDVVHSSVLFKVKHMGVAYAYGRFNGMSGSFSIDPDDPSDSFIEMTIDVSSIDTANDGRDDHLRSSDYFNVEAFPEASFTSTSITRKGGGLEVTGDFTLKGETRRVTAPLEFVGEAQTRRGDKAGFHCELVISRSEFGVGGPGGLGDEVTVIVSIEGGR